MFYLPLPTSPKKAKEIGCNKYFTGVPCKRGHINFRYTSNKRCADCEVYYRKKYRDMYPERVKELKKEAHKKYREKHLHSIRQRERDYYADNKDRIKELKKLRCKKNGYDKTAAAYKRKNRAKCTAYENKRRAQKLSAAPNWLSEFDKLAIEEIYEMSNLISVSTSIPHQVDHIVPLKNSIVCGLHVPWNLQVITEEENQSKNNIFNGIR